MNNNDVIETNAFWNLGGKITEEECKEFQSNITKVNAQQANELGKKLFEMFKNYANNSSKISPLQTIGHYINPAQKLINGGANVNYVDSDSGETSLLMCLQGYTQGVLIHDLLLAGADVNKANNYGITPLMVAAKLNSTYFLSLLLSLGADINAKDNDGNTALLIAKINENKEAVKFLLENGASINAQNNNGESFLSSSIAESSPLKEAIQEAENELYAITRRRLKK